ncbi:MAG: DUF6531 domain-containing protein [Proteobacteria bacterium]|nr:DUF6531 domain-containing protein [Pseudomonadota bacterium]
MKKFQSVIFASLVTFGITNASNDKYVYQTSFGQPDPTQLKSFSSQADLEKYLHSFGYLSSHLDLLSSEKYSGTLLLQYGIKDGAISFQGKTGVDKLYGSGYKPSHLQHKGLYSSPDDYLKSIFRCAEKDCHITNISSTKDWKYDQYQMIQNEDNNDPDSKYDYIYYRTYNVEYSYIDQVTQKETTASTTDEVYKYEELDCTPPESDHFGDYIKYIVHQYGLYKPDDNNDSGNCIYNKIASLIAVATGIEVNPEDNQNESCKISADPVDVTTGAVRESVTDLAVNSANPIYIKRYYSRDDSLWHFSYTRRLEVNDADKITVVRDNGDKYKFAKVGDKIVPENGLHATLVVKGGDQVADRIYTYTLPDGTSEEYNYFGMLQKITHPNGTVTSLSADMSSGVSTIDDGFGHVITLTPSAGYSAMTLTLNGGHAITYHFKNALQSDITEVDYPNGTKVLYNYITSGSDLPVLSSMLNGVNKMISTWEYNSDSKAVSNNMYR